jgi:single-strand DNA-binding protein
VNVCNFIGRIGKDAEVRSTPSGKPVTNWSIAVDSGFGEQKKTTWITCTLWGDRGPKIAGYIHKGDKIGVSGELSTREYEYQGTKRTSVELNVREVELLGSKERSGSGTTPAPTPASAAPEGGDPYSDDIPFSPCEYGSLA